MPRDPNLVIHRHRGLKAQGVEEGVEVSTRRRVDQANRPLSSEGEPRASSVTWEVGVAAGGEMTLEEVRVLVVEHRLNGQLSMRVAAVGRLPADTCVIARPDPLWGR